MRIAVVTTSYPTFEGDPSGHFVKNEVLELEREGHDVTIITPRAGGAFGWPGAAARISEKPHRAFEAAGWLAKATLAVRRANPERLIAHWCVPCAWPIARSLPASCSLDIVSHGGDVRLLRRLPSPMRTSIVRRLLARATGWRFVSRSLLEELEGVLDPDDAKDLRALVEIAPSPLGMLDVRAEVAARREELGDRRLYVCAGRLIPSKRVDKVIDYVASERTDAPRVLVVLGDGPQRTHLERLARAWQLDVRFLGTKSRRETLGWIGAADEVVHASKAEGLSTVIREAEELGVPVTILP